LRIRAVAGLKPIVFQPFTAQSKTTRNPRKNRTAAAKAGQFNNLCGTGKPVPFVGSGSPIQLLGAGPHPVFISLGEPQAHGDTTEVVP
jgi:endonuclease YncB( thermonuclease family)